MTEPYAGKVLAAHPYQVTQIANARLKTDKQYVYHLVHLLKTDLAPAVWKPS